MLRKLTGIFILLSFLLVKNIPAFSIDKERVVVSVLGDHDADEQSEESESSKQFEYTDEEVVPFPGLSFVPVSASSAKLDTYFVGQTTTAYLSLPYPPPDRLA